MKGQKLLVRPATGDDLPQIRALYLADGAELTESTALPALVAKLVGDCVGHLAWSRDGSDLVIEQIYVSRPLRRKRIGRQLLLELRHLARAMHCNRLVVPPRCLPGEFFARAGFTESGGVLQTTLGESDGG